jgi:hypothetical protein
MCTWSIPRISLADLCRPGPLASLDIQKGMRSLDPDQALVVGKRSHENGYVAYIGGASLREQFVDILLAFFGTGF